MTNLDSVRRPSGTESLLARLKSALVVFGPEDQRLRLHQRGPLDPFHTLGAQTTAELAGTTAVFEAS